MLDLSLFYAHINRRNPKRQPLLFDLRESNLLQNFQERFSFRKLHNRVRQIRVRFSMFGNKLADQWKNRFEVEEVQLLKGKHARTREFEHNNLSAVSQYSTHLAQPFLKMLEV